MAVLIANKDLETGFVGFLVGIIGLLVAFWAYKPRANSPHKKEEMMIFFMIFNVLFFELTMKYQPIKNELMRVLINEWFCLNLWGYHSENLLFEFLNSNYYTLFIGRGNFESK